MTLSQEIYQDITAQLPAIKEALAQGVAYGGELMGRVIQYDLVWNIFLLSIIFLLVISLGYMIINTRIRENKLEIRKSEAYDFYFLYGLGIIILFIILLVVSNLIIKDIYIPEIRVIEIISNFKLN